MTRLPEEFTAKSCRCRRNRRVTRRCTIGILPGITSVSSIRVLHLYISPGHSFFGRHEKPPAKFAILEVPEIVCVAGRGIEGDRFLDFKPDYQGQITFFAAEVYEELCATMRVRDKAPSVFRRNVISKGVDLNELVGREFEIQGVRFLGMAECTPCYWMNRAFAPGAERFLKGRGGLRAKILVSGNLQSEAADSLQAPSARDKR